MFPVYVIHIRMNVHLNIIFEISCHLFNCWIRQRYSNQRSVITVADRTEITELTAHKCQIESHYVHREAVNCEGVFLPPPVMKAKTAVSCVILYWHVGPMTGDRRQQWQPLPLICSSRVTVAATVRYQLPASLTCHPATHYVFAVFLSTQTVNSDVLPS